MIGLTILTCFVLISLLIIFVHINICLTNNSHLFLFVYFHDHSGPAASYKDHRLFDLPERGPYTLDLTLNIYLKI